MTAHQLLDFTTAGGSVVIVSVIQLAVRALYRRGKRLEDA